MCCVNAGFDNRHPDTFTPKLRGYEQKRYRGFGRSEVSRPVTFAKPFPAESEVDGELVQLFQTADALFLFLHLLRSMERKLQTSRHWRVHVLIWGDLQAYP